MFPIEQGEKNTLELFRFAAKTVPAYQSLLKEKGIDPSSIKTIGDFKNLPIIDKDSYLRKYPYRDLFPNRDMSSSTTISATSGSTGEPFYFPRGEEQDAQYEYIAERFLTKQFGVDKKRNTLCVLSFGLGIWIGGIFTYKVFNKIASKGYKLTILSMGPNKELFLKSLKKFVDYFDTIILAGYPPFIKDILDESGDYDIQWKKYNTKILTATETFSEEFRDYLCEKTHIKNPLTDVINIYGTVELGTMAHETPLTTLIRKRAIRDERVFKAVFREANRLPTLAQYYPDFVYLEGVEGEVIGSGYGSSIPLVRYRFHDRGGVILFDDIIKRLLEDIGVDILAEAKGSGINIKTFRLPFVYVYERSDLVTTLYGINIYPEYIRYALQNTEITDQLTGKFTMVTKTDESLNQFLEINIELRKDVGASDLLKEAIKRLVVNILMERCTEYNYLWKSDPERYAKRLTPKVLFWSYEDPRYFAPGGKQKWTIKQDAVSL